MKSANRIPLGEARTSELILPYNVCEILAPYSEMIDLFINSSKRRTAPENIIHTIFKSHVTKIN